MTIQLLHQFNGFAPGIYSSMGAVEEARLVGIGLARYWTPGIDGKNTQFSEAEKAAGQALVSGDWNANQQAVVDAGGGLVVADLSGNLTGPGGAISGGGGGGSSTFAGLTDKASADLPTINTPLSTALGLKAPLANPTFTGTVSGITKAMVGLSNVDNTADTAKPVSTAQQTALNLKANLAGPTFTGVPAAPTASPGTNTTQIATTAFVLANAGSALGPYASTSALQSGAAAASNTGRIGLVGSSAPYTPYISNGTAWVVFDSGADPLVTIASSGATVSQAAANLSVLDVTLTANTTIGFSGIPPGAWTATLILKQDATGARLVTWPANTKWASGPAPTLSTAAAAIDVITLMTTDGGTTWYGFLNGRGMV